MDEIIGEYKIDTIITGKKAISYYSESQRRFLFRKFIPIMKKAEYVFLHCNNLDRVKEVRDEILLNKYFFLSNFFIKVAHFLDVKIQKLRKRRRSRQWLGHINVSLGVWP